MRKSYAVAQSCIVPIAWAIQACSQSGESLNRDGALLYENTCALCHGSKGEGYQADNATALASPTFLSTASDTYLRRSIERGRPGSTMSAWSIRNHGPHTDDDIRAIVSYIRRFQTEPTVTLEVGTVTGDPARGAPVYTANCASCHGTTGTEGPNVRLANPEFLALASDGFLRHAIQAGRPGTAMAAYGSKLQDQEVRDLVALIRSWQKPISEVDASAPPSFASAVLNPNGGEPEFVLGERFTPADTVKRELSLGKSLVFADARPPSDYLASHVSGAVNVPFYEAEKYVPLLPSDRWIVAYCACPHAESGRVYDVLVANGFKKVTILDEGYFTWRDRGYPVTSGSSP